MDTSDEHTVQATSSAEDEHPSKHQHLKKRGSSNRPVVVYDYDRKTVQVRNKKNVESIYQKIKFPARSKQVTLFIDGADKSRLTTECVGRDGQTNVMLAQLYLDRLGPSGQIFRHFGMLSTLYVVKAGS